VARIAAIEPIVLRLPAGVDAERIDGTGDAFLVRVTDEEGRVGLGEADTAPLVARAAVEMPPSHSVCVGLREIAVGLEATEPERVWQALFDRSRYYGRRGATLHAISAIDIAVHDLAARTAGVPLAQYLGGSADRRIRVYASFVMPETPDEVRELCRLAAGRGYRAVKFGWGPLGRSPELDRALVGAARAELGPDRELFVDGGQCWDVEGAVRAAATFAELGVGWLEEPLPPDDLEGYAALAARSAVPIAAGEQCEGVAEFAALAATGVGVLQPDISRCGGYTVARRVAALAAERGVECIPHLYSTGVLTAASLHFVAGSPRGRTSELSVVDSPLANDLLTTRFAVEDGEVAVPAGPGLGIELDEAVVDRYRVA
jgi:L-alanine-DL-glutamate epimerase-like enolase superfamily enzyme